LEVPRRDAILDAFRQRSITGSQQQAPELIGQLRLYELHAAPRYV
jgi:hypothetical protein